MRGPTYLSKYIYYCKFAALLLHSSVPIFNLKPKKTVMLTRSNFLGASLLLIVVLMQMAM